MPQPSIAYAVGRVRAASRKPLDRVQLQRLLAASDYQEALKALTEMGWPMVDHLSLDRVSEARLQETCQLLRAVTPDEQLTNAFLLRHDAQNLKALFKARILGQEAGSLSACGTIPLPVLQHAVTERVYRRLPPAFELAMEALEKSTALEVNPMQIDTAIDRALYQTIQGMVKNSTSKPAQTYFKGKIDLQNAVTFLRVKAMNRQDIRFSDLMLPGGSIPYKEWAVFADQPERLVRRLLPYGNKVRLALEKAIVNPALVPALEKAADDWLLAQFRPFRYDAFSIEVLIAWLLAYERETAAVRLILAGKLNGFPIEAIQERLRELYD